MYDDEFLYVAAEMLDSEPDKIIATQMIQGNIFADDRFWVAVDSINDKRNDYFFQVNANGVTPCGKTTCTVAQYDNV